MLSPRGRVQNYKFLMKGARRKPKGGAGFFLWCGIAAVFILMKQQKQALSALIK